MIRRTRKGSALVVSLGLAAALGVAVGPGAAGAAGPVPAGPGEPPPLLVGAAKSSGPGVSTDWAGYAVTGQTYTSVTGSWRVPQVSTPTQTKKTYYSTDWIGIDGDAKKDTSLIQTGTEADWYKGKPFYRAWWEILPTYPVENVISTLTISAGDSMSASIVDGGSSWTITLNDDTTGKSFTTSQPYSGPLSSAEWIHEAPTISGGKIAKLAPDGPVTFDLGTVNGANPGLVWPSEAIVMHKGKNVLAIPSTPDSDGDGFTVATGSTQPPPPSS